MVKIGAVVVVSMTMLLMLRSSALRVHNGVENVKVSEFKTSESKAVRNISKKLASLRAPTSDNSSSEDLRCQVRMAEPYQGFRYSFDVPLNKDGTGTCMKCNDFTAMERMPADFFIGFQCAGPGDEQEICQKVSKTRPMWSQFCVCAILKEQYEIKPAIAFPGAGRRGNMCGPESCWDFIQYVQEKRARDLGSKLSFGANAIDKPKLVSECASCSSGALPPKKQKECSEHRLGLGKDSGGFSSIKLDDEWVTNSELGDEDDSDDHVVVETEVEKPPGKTTHEISVGTNISTSEEGTQVNFPQETEELLKSMLDEQKKLYDDLLRRLRGELGQARLDLATQAEIAKNSCFNSISELRKQIKDSEASSWQKERLKIIESHNTQIALLTKNLAANGNADKAALEAQFNKLLLEAKNLCKEEKQALTEQLQNQCKADSSALELRIRTELGASCQEECKSKVQTNDEEWKKKEIIWIESNKAYEKQAVEAKGKQAEAEEQWRKINEQYTLEVTARKKLEELLKSEREAWARDRKALEDKVTSATNSALASQNMKARLQKTCDEEKNRTYAEYHAYLGQFRVQCESQIQLVSDQKTAAEQAVTAAKEQCNQQLQLVQNSSVSIEQTFETRFNAEVKRQEDKCEDAKKEQYSHLERECGATIQMKVEEARSEEFKKHETEIKELRVAWEQECVKMHQTQKDAWLAQARTEYEQNVANIQSDCKTQMDYQLQVQAQLQEQITAIYAAGMKEYERANACVVEGQARITQAEKSESLCKQQGTQIILQMKDTLQKAQVQCENSRQEAISTLTLKHQQETEQLTQTNHQCQQKLADQGKLTELIGEHQAKNQECIQQTQTLNLQLSEAVQTIEAARNDWNSKNVELNQCKIFASACDKERTEIRSERDTSVNYHKSQVEECVKAANIKLEEQAHSAKVEAEALEKRYITSLTQHQDRYNAEAKAHQHDNQQCQEQINIVNAQSRELTVQYQAAVENYQRECSEYVEKERKTTEEKHTQHHTQEMERLTTQYTDQYGQLEKQLSDCVNGLNANNATAKQQLQIFQEQVAQARTQIKAEQDRFQACFTQGTKIYNEYEASKEEWARKEKTHTDTYNECLRAGQQLQQTKSAVDQQLAQCSQQVQEAAQLLEQAQTVDAHSGDMPLPFCPICLKHCTAGDVRLKVYKGGQFLPEHGSLPFSDPNKRAPAGGCVCCLAPGYSSFLQMATKSITA